MQFVRTYVIIKTVKRIFVSVEKGGQYGDVDFDASGAAGWRCICSVAYVYGKTADPSRVGADVCRSPAEVAFLLCGDILNAGALTRQMQKAGKLVLIHMDLLGGIGRDSQAVEYLAQSVRPDGIISTRSQLIRAARDRSLLTVQRFFLLDSQSVAMTAETAAAVRPDMVEAATTPEGLDKVQRLSRMSVPSVNLRAVITSFAGLRACSDGGDFIIGPSAVNPRFLNAAGIESPGLTASPAIAEEMVKLLKDAGLELTEKPGFDPKRKFNPPATANNKRQCRSMARTGQAGQTGSYRKHW